MFLNLIQFLTVILSILIIANANNEWSKQIYFNKIVTTSNPKYLQRFIINTSKNRTQLDVFSDIVQRYPANFWMAIIATVNPDENHRSRPMLDQHMQFCQFYGKRVFQMRGIIKTWIRDFMRFSNFSEDCPQQTGNYSWIGLPVDKLTIPKFFPSDKYEVKVRFYARQKSVNETISQIHLQLEIK